MTDDRTQRERASHVIWFRSLHRDGHALAFPCDRFGLVDFDALSERARDSYFFARKLIGREYAAPEVQICS